MSPRRCATGPHPRAYPTYQQSVLRQEILAIGGSGNWDYLTLDPVARRLYIAHGQVVQVVDVDSGSVAGEITGFREAHAIALDDIIYQRLCQ